MHWRNVASQGSHQRLGYRETLVSPISAPTPIAFRHCKQHQPIVVNYIRQTDFHTFLRWRISSMECNWSRKSCASRLAWNLGRSNFSLSRLSSLWWSGSCTHSLYDQDQELSWERGLGPERAFWGGWIIELEVNRRFVFGKHVFVTLSTSISLSVLGSEGNSREPLVLRPSCIAVVPSSAHSFELPCANPTLCFVLTKPTHCAQAT